MEPDKDSHDNRHVDLTEFDTDILQRKGWHLVCMRKIKERAIEKADSIDRKTGIRKKEADGEITYEVWDKWFGVKQIKAGLLPVLLNKVL